MSRSIASVDLGSVCPAPHPAVETAFLAPEVVLFDDRHGEIHHLNPSASAVWLTLDGQRSIADVATELSELFGVPESVTRPDVEAIVADFRQRGLLAGADRAGAADRAGSRVTADDEVPQRTETLAPPPNP